MLVNLEIRVGPFLFDERETMQIHADFIDELSTRLLGKVETRAFAGMTSSTRGPRDYAMGKKKGPENSESDEASDVMRYH